MKFYTSDTSTLGAKVAVVIAIKGINVDQINPDKRSNFLPSNLDYAGGIVPTLIHKSFILRESEVIAEYLEETFPNPALLPGNSKSRAQVRFFSRFHDLYVEPELRTLLRQMDPRIQDMDVVLPAVEQLNQSLQILDSQCKPKPYLSGNTLTLADCGYPVTLMQADIILEILGMKPKLTRKLSKWRDTLEEHPAVENVLNIWRLATIVWLENTLKRPD